MRLICPNCGAEYEVADDVIPEGGRDVQCSNCGHTWFEQPGASEAREAAAADADLSESWDAENADADDAAEDTTPPSEPWDEDEDEGDPWDSLETAAEADEADAEADETTDAAWGADPEDDPRAADADTDDAAAPDWDDVDAEADEDTPAPTAPPQRAPLAPSIAEILREEAAREEAARAAERDTGLESQGELGLPETGGPEERRAREARDRIARLKGEDPEAETAAAIAATVATSRRETLPDIEEINSTLRPSSDRPDVPMAEEEIEQRRGFRLGFLSVLGVIIVGSLIYLFAAQIAEAVPALSDALAAYVAAVDNLRIWVDMQVKGLLAMLDADDATG